MRALTAETVMGADPFGIRLRVLHVLQPTEAGVWAYAAAMAQFQSERGWEVHVASPARPRGEFTWHQWNSQRSPVRGVPDEIKALRRIVDATDPDVVVAHSSKAGMIARLVLRGRRTTVFIPHAWSFAASGGVVGLTALAWERFATRYTNAVVGVGPAEVARGLARRIYAPYFLVPNPVLPSWGQQGGSIPHDLSENPPDVVCIARLSRQKGVDVLLAAWQMVRDACPDAQLLIVGDGPDRSVLEAAAGPGVTFVGAQQTPRAFVEAAPVCVVPSRWEGLSLSMLEAMWSGRSMVVTDVDGSEVVRDAECGVAVPVEDPQALADALIERLSGADLARSEGERAAAYAIEHHDFATSASRLAAVISRAYAFGRSWRAQRAIVGTSRVPGRIDHRVS